MSRVIQPAKLVNETKIYAWDFALADGLLRYGRHPLGSYLRQLDHLGGESDAEAYRWNPWRNLPGRLYYHNQPGTDSQADELHRYRAG